MGRNLDNLKIHAFRGLRDLELEGLGGVNLFVGPNNSGKTSVLEAIAAFSRPLDPQVWVDAVRRREFRLTGSTLVEGLRWLFPQPENLPPEAAFDSATFIEGSGGFAVRESRARGRTAIFVGPAATDWNEELDADLPDDGEQRPGVILDFEVRTASSASNGVVAPIGRSFELVAGRFTKVQGSPTDPAADRRHFAIRPPSRKEPSPPIVGGRT